MLLEANFPQNCGEKHLAQLTTYRIVYLQNLPNDKTPYEIWMKREPNLYNLRVFHYKAYAYINKTKRGKLGERAEQGILVGYDNQSKGYIIYKEYRRLTSNICQNNQIHRE